MSVVDLHLANLRETGHGTFDVKITNLNNLERSKLLELVRASQTLMSEDASNGVRVVGITDELPLINR